MKTTNTFKKYVALSALVVVLAACAAASGRETSGEYVDDATITSKVKSAIIGDSNLKMFQISAETMQGVVQLSGFVDNRQTEEKAVDIARQVKGVKSVKDDLIVR